MGIEQKRKTRTGRIQEYPLTGTGPCDYVVYLTLNLSIFQEAVGRTGVSSAVTSRGGRKG